MEKSYASAVGQGAVGECLLEESAGGEARCSGGAGTCLPPAHPRPSVEILNACTHLLVFTALLGLKVTFRIKPTVKGLLRWCDSVGQYGIKDKVSSWGSGTPSMLK
jgi:hypothetical protein